MRSFAGVYTPVVTPFTPDNALDERGLKKNVERYIRSPLTGLVILGSNGEAPQLEDSEADRAIEIARASMPSDRPLLAGTGRESTVATIAATKRAAKIGADAVLVRTPSFYKGQMTTDAFVHHFTAVADQSPVPVLLYNVTMYTGVNLLPDAVAKLSEHKNIAGMKETNSDMVQMAEHLARTKSGFLVLAGSAATYYASLALGVHGAILAVAGVAPELVCEIYELSKAGKFAEARALARKLAPISKSVGSQWGVPGLKAALDLIGLAGGVPRPPLQPVTAATVDVLRGQLKDLELLPVPA